MRTKQLTAIIILVFMGVLAAAGPGTAQGIKERMKQRLPVIAELKKKGIVGENNRGYLDFVGSQKSHEDLVARENQDRKTIYTHIAAQQNTRLLVVEKNRALQLAERAAPGTYFQKPDGTWVQK
ncbi:MAG: YdbL family protein [Desulfotignum sp.]|nr:YdbL family protein [Desulfotignum sp.]MCF8114328.1 YdbL family protein [Desulfotignum sp.]MCF8125417.1 YdbL family protein [Desulfotignum sp.]